MHPNARIDVVVRADDAGMSLSANAAIEEALRAGVVRNVSVMAVGPELEDAARRLAAFDDVCVGLHTTLNGEWDRPKYRPILPADQVPTLVDENGCFLPSPINLHERPFDLDEAMAEIEAQLGRLRDVGLNPSYLDEHMAIGWLSGMRERLDAFAREHGLLRVTGVSYLHVSDSERPEELTRSWVDLVRQETTGPLVLVGHPLSGTPEDETVTNENHPVGYVATRRNADRMAMISPDLQSSLEQAGARLVRYTDLALPQPQQDA